jgi:solute carrier family 45, member 1/2/4
MSLTIIQIHLESLGLSPAETAITLLSGPICGAIFQPYFGSWSDRCRSSWGQRKPFIIIGTIVLISSIFALAWADSITWAIVLATMTYESSKTVLVVLSILLTFIMFVAVQAVQVSLRAMIIDNCTPLEQTTVNAWAGRHINFSGVLAYLAAYVDLPGPIHVFGKTVFAHTSILTTLYLVATITITCLNIKEREIETATSQSKHGMTNLRVLRWIFLEKASQVRVICLVQFFSWLGWFPFLFYTVTYDHPNNISPKNIH